MCLHGLDFAAHARSAWLFTKSTHTPGTSRQTVEMFQIFLLKQRQPLELINILFLHQKSKYAVIFFLLACIFRWLKKKGHCSCLVALVDTHASQFLGREASWHWETVIYKTWHASQYSVFRQESQWETLDIRHIQVALGGERALCIFSVAGISRETRSRSDTHGLPPTVNTSHSLQFSKIAKYVVFNT